VGRAVEDALDIGYRHLDCALAYENEDEIGEAIQKKIAQGIVRRNELFITSKVFKNGKSDFCLPFVMDCPGN
jgi:diketogulonate reductase-like aldo/keto reductase